MTASRCEDLREACAIGNQEKALHLISQGVDVNDKNPMNGWTALHWSAKRGHVQLTQFLLTAGADAHIEDQNGRTPLDVATSPEIRLKLGGSPEVEAAAEELPIVPNYLQNPVFPHGAQQSYSKATTLPVVQRESSSKPSTDLVLKARVALGLDPDFIEVELPRTQLTFAALTQLLCSELRVQEQHVAKIRKLPDTKLRNDSDVARLRDFQALEIVLEKDLNRHDVLNSGRLTDANVSSTKPQQLVY